MPECVRFYFDTMKKGTLAARARLDIELVPVRLRCVKCHTEVKDLAPACECKAGVEFVSGQELFVDYVEVETAPKMNAEGRSKGRAGSLKRSRAGRNPS